MGIKTTGFVGKGKIYLAAGTNPLVAIGNVSKLTLNVTEDKVELQDYETSGGGVIASISRVKSINVSMTANSFSPANLSVALRGTVTANAGTVAIVGETHEGITAGLIQLARLPDATKTFAVLKGSTPFTEGTDYVITNSGFEVLAGGAIVEGDDLLVSYTPLADNLLQALTTGATDYRFVFEGLNEANSGSPFVVEIYKLQLSPTKTFELISDKFGDLNLEGTVLKDTTKQGTGISQYLRIRQVA